MIEIEEARSRILAESQTLEAVTLSTADALDQVLAEPIKADVDSPPHDKALVDGFAIRVEDAGRSLSVLEQVVAGATPTQTIVTGMCSQVMTGAPIPRGAEAMVMVEQTEMSGDTVKIHAVDVAVGDHIMPRGKVFARGDQVLTRGTRLRAVEIGLLSEVGRSHVLAHRRPRVAILPTGNELVPCEHTPGAGQIRNSNGPMLEACVRRHRGDVVSLGIGRDEEPQLRRQIERGLTADVLVISGGVSAGVRDLVPQTLRSLGVREVFHKVRLKPGKPLWFGVRTDATRRTLVFGLPGNPVSSLVCFELFVAAAIRKLSGSVPLPAPVPVRLAEPFVHRGQRPTYHPGVMTLQAGRMLARPLGWLGSADLVAICRADCLIAFPSGDRAYEIGDEVEALPLD